MTTELPLAIAIGNVQWKSVDGIDIPISEQFGDVYFSDENGLDESRYVFLQANQLATRLAALSNNDYFCVAETGFGTGLNILALLQLWHQVQPDNRSWLHAISVEKFPLTHADLSRALAVWPELADYAQALLAQYPMLIPGCHRLVFAQWRFSLDLWLGDAAAALSHIPDRPAVDAWFLDGFAPSCNAEMWQQQLLQQICRLSHQQTTLSSFSVAALLRHTLDDVGIKWHRQKGFGRKRHMLVADFSLNRDIQPNQAIENVELTQSINPIKNIEPIENSNLDKNIDSAESIDSAKTIDSIAIIGAGVAGLCCAYQLAIRGYKVSIFEANQVLSGGSGNPRALLSPKISQSGKTAHHLMSMCWPYSLNFYQHATTAYTPLTIYQLINKDIESNQDIAATYPDHLVKFYDQQQVSQQLQGCQAFAAMQLQSAMVTPEQFARDVLAHPEISLCKQSIGMLQRSEHQWQLFNQNQLIASYHHVIICSAEHSHLLSKKLMPAKPIRGQVSVANSKNHLQLNGIAFSYGGYCVTTDSKSLLFGASFQPCNTDRQITDEDHQHNFLLLKQALPNLSHQLEPMSSWQGRVSIRAQSPDYLPMVGQIETGLWTLTALGAKGFLFAPLCSEMLCAMLLNRHLPVTAKLAHMIRVQRFRKSKVAAAQQQL